MRTLLSRQKRDFKLDCFILFVCSFYLSKLPVCSISQIFWNTLRGAYWWWDLWPRLIPRLRDSTDVLAYSGAAGGQILLKEREKGV